MAHDAGPSNYLLDSQTPLPEALSLAETEEFWSIASFLVEKQRTKVKT
jgi:hypothetical protein